MTVRSLVVTDSFGVCDEFAVDGLDVQIRTDPSDNSLEVFTLDSDGIETPLGGYADGGRTKWRWHG